MWNEAIKSIKTSDEVWIKNNRQKFLTFFKEQNNKPAGGFGSEARQAHVNSKLFKIFLTTSYNGLQLPLHTGSQWIEHASTLEGNWGWLLAIGVGGAYFADHMPEHIAKKYFSPADALVAGSGKPNGKAVKVSDEHWEVNGTWEYCSGSEQASVFTAVTYKQDQITAVILPKAEVEIIRDWDTFGLPLTCSHTIKAKNILISADHFFDLTTPPKPSAYPLGAYPFDLFALACFVPVVTGISIAFWDEVEEHLAGKKEVWQKFQPGRYDLVWSKLQEFRQLSGNLGSQFYEVLEESWENHLSNLNPSEEKMRKTGLELAQICCKSCSEIYPELGMQVLDKSHPLQLSWQNLQVAYQHGIFHSYKM